MGEGVRELYQILDKVKPQLVTIRIRDGGSDAYVHKSQLWGLGISHIEAALLTFHSSSLELTDSQIAHHLHKNRTQLVSIAALCQVNITDQRLRYIHVEEVSKKAA